MPDFKEIYAEREAEPTTTTARLPHLDIEIEHRPAAGGEGERISIHVEAVPSFESFGRILQAANPWSFWTQAMQLAWSPWLNGAHALNAMMFTPWGLPRSLRDQPPDDGPFPKRDRS